MSKEYKLFIPAAGTGSRLGEICKYLNKSLVSVANRPGICHIIEKFPEDVRVVVALGYRGELVKEFLGLAYPKRTFEFLEVHPFEGPGSGLGLSVLRCRAQLQCPFIFSSCDTIVDGPIPPPDENWMGYTRVENADSYRTLGVSGNAVTAIREKRAADAEPNAYIGLAGVKDYQAFWEAMSAEPAREAIAQGESFGLRGLLKRGISAYPFTWYDTGTPDNLAAARTALRPVNAPNILPKANEDIWFVEDSVIKFSADPKFIADRVTRSRTLDGYAPQIEGAGVHMYKYRRASGEVLSKCVTLPRFKKLLDHAQRFWAAKPLSDADKGRFETVCLDFYRAKTYQRVDQFYKTFDRKDTALSINGINVPSDAELLGRVDWKILSQGRPGNFHGDFHFENILFDEGTEQFTFLDWRQNFGGLMDVGDVYYDLAKLNHGLIVCHELIAQDQFAVHESPHGVRFELLRKQSVVECERALAEFVVDNGYDLRRVKILTALIYLNIAALHHYPYSLLLYYLGRSMLAELVAAPCSGTR